MDHRTFAAHVLLLQAEAAVMEVHAHAVQTVNINQGRQSFVQGLNPETQHSCVCRLSKTLVSTHADHFCAELAPWTSAAMLLQFGNPCRPCLDQDLHPELSIHAFAGLEDSPPPKRGQTLLGTWPLVETIIAQGLNPWP